MVMQTEKLLQRAQLSIIKINFRTKISPSSFSLPIFQTVKKYLRLKKSIVVAEQNLMVNNLGSRSPTNKQGSGNDLSLSNDDLEGNMILRDLECDEDPD